MIKRLTKKIHNGHRGEMRVLTKQCVKIQSIAFKQPLVRRRKTQRIENRYGGIDTEFDLKKE